MPNAVMDSLNYKTCRASLLSSDKQSILRKPVFVVARIFEVATQPNPLSEQPEDNIILFGMSRFEFMISFFVLSLGVTHTE